MLRLRMWGKIRPFLKSNSFNIKNNWFSLNENKSIHGVWFSYKFEKHVRNI